MKLGERIRNATDAFLATAPERSLERATVSAFRSFTWPVSGPLSNDLPDWVDAWLAYALPLTRKTLGHVDAFSSVPIVQAAVSKLAEDVASVERKVWRGRGDAKKEVERTGRLVDEGGTLADLLGYANPIMTGRQMILRTIATRLLTGNGYWYTRRFRGPGRPPNELWPLPGHRVAMVPGPRRSLFGYEFKPGDASAWDVPRNLRFEDVIPFSNLHVEDRPDGLSPLESAQFAYAGEYYALTWFRDFFRKGGNLAGVWTTQKGDNVAPPKPADIKAIKQALRKQAGYDQAWEPIIIAGIDFVANAMKLSEMELPAHIAALDRKVLQVLHLPPWKIGMEKEGGLGQAGAGKMDDATYWLETVKALCDELDDVVTERLCPMFGTDLSVKSDLNKVLAVQNARLEQAKVHGELAGGRSIETVNEAREAMDLPEVADPSADELWTAPVPVPGAAGAGDGPPAKEGPPSQPKAANRAARFADESGREALRSRARVSLDRFRAALETIVVERLAEQRATARERLRAQWEAEHASIEARDSGGAVRLAIDSGRLLDEASEGDAERVKRLLAELLKARALEVLREMGSGVEVDTTAARWGEFVRRMADRAINLPDRTTAQLMRESLAQGLEASEGLDQLLARLDQVFETRRANAMTVARTETQPAYNFATYEAGRESGIVEGHEWLTSHSGTGGRHAENPQGRYDGLDGQFRALGQPFDVGGVQLMYPGDPDGPPGEIINCVCTLVGKLSPVDARARAWGDFIRGRWHTNGNGKPKNRITAFLSGRA